MFQHVIPQIAAVGQPRGQHVIFMQDGAPPHPPSRSEQTH